MFRAIGRYFSTGPDLPMKRQDPASLRREYERRRWSVFLSVTLGYGFFYLCRLSFSMAKKPMLDGGVLTEQDMGVAGGIMLLVYSLGRLTNGVLADRANIRRFISWGLLGSALANLALGFTPGALFFTVLWAVNGWFQSIGSAPCIVSLTQWFSPSERGTRYGLWSIAHGIGEGLSFLFTSLLVAGLGWQWGFWGPGLFCVVVAFVLVKTLMDRPQTYGLPRVDIYRGDPGPAASDPVAVAAGADGATVADRQAYAARVKAMQWAVIRNWQVWALGLAGAMMYVARYGMNNWGSLYLQEARGYTLVESGALLAIHPAMGLVGSAASGWVSDKFFGSRRNLPCLILGGLLVLSLAMLWIMPPGQKWLDTLALGIFGFSVGGLLVYLGGLMATDVVPQEATGTAMGLVGFLCYGGAALQDLVSGQLIGEGRAAQTGTAAYETAMVFWLGAAVLAMVLPLLVWRQKHPQTLHRVS